MKHQRGTGCSQERLQHEEAVAANNGVWWRAKLRVVLSDVDAAAEKGIRRGARPDSSPALLVREWQASLFFIIIFGS